MDKKILIPAIGIFFIVSSIPFAEGSLGWLQEIGFPMDGDIRTFSESLVVEPQGEGTISLICPSDYVFLTESPLVTLTPHPQSNSGITTGYQTANNERQSEFGPTVKGGWIVQVGSNNNLAEDTLVEVSIVCVKPSIMNGVGGEVGGLLIQPDTTALFLAYGIVNAFWLVPTFASIGAGVYFTKSMWRKK